MKTASLPIEVFNRLQRHMGAEDAILIAKTIEDALQGVDQRSQEKVEKMKDKVKQELRMELRDELATKADLHQATSGLEVSMVSAIADLRLDVVKLDRKFTIILISMFFVFLLSNPGAQALVFRLFGIIK